MSFAIPPGACASCAEGVGVRAGGSAFNMSPLTFLRFNVFGLISAIAAVAVVAVVAVVVETKLQSDTSGGAAIAYRKARRKSGRSMQRDYDREVQE